MMRRFRSESRTFMWRSIATSPKEQELMTTSQNCPKALIQVASHFFHKSSKQRLLISEKKTTFKSFEFNVVFFLKSKLSTVFSHKSKLSTVFFPQVQIIDCFFPLSPNYRLFFSTSPN